MLAECYEWRKETHVLFIDLEREHLTPLSNIVSDASSRKIPQKNINMTKTLYQDYGMDSGMQRTNYRENPSK